MARRPHDLNAMAACSIRQLREDQGWSQEELAYQCGLHRTYVGAIERCERNITLTTLARLADALSVDAADLLRKRVRSGAMP